VELDDDTHQRSAKRKGKGAGRDKPSVRMVTSESNARIIPTEADSCYSEIDVYGEGDE